MLHYVYGCNIVKQGGGMKVVYVVENMKNSDVLLRLHKDANKCEKHPGAACIVIEKEFDKMYMDGNELIISAMEHCVENSHMIPSGDTIMNCGGVNGTYYNIALTILKSLYKGYVE